MKKRLIWVYGVLGLALVSLGFWYLNAKESTNDSHLAATQKRSTEKVTSTETTEETKTVTSEELYQKVFDDYAIILAYGQKHIQAGQDFVSTVLDRLQVVVTNSWVVENAIADINAIHYAFIDLDGDGQDEMITAIKNADGTIFITGLFMLQGGSPVELANGFVAYHGGSRSQTILYTKGRFLAMSWMSGTGEATGILSEIKGQTVSDVRTEDFTMAPETAKGAMFGVTKDEEIDLNTLDWQSFEMPTVQEPKTTTGKMDVNAILAGDVSSIQGTWRSVSGESFTISGHRFSDPEYLEEYTISNFREYNGHVQWTLAGIMASPPVYVMVPAGTPLNDSVTTYHTDESKDRIYLMPQVLLPEEEFLKHVYYKVD